MQRRASSSAPCRSTERRWEWAARRRGSRRRPSLWAAVWRELCAKWRGHVNEKCEGCVPLPTANVDALDGEAPRAHGRRRRSVLLARARALLRTTDRLTATTLLAHRGRTDRHVQQPRRGDSGRAVGARCHRPLRRRRDGAERSTSARRTTSRSRTRTSATPTAATRRTRAATLCWSPTFCARRPTCSRRAVRAPRCAATNRVWAVEASAERNGLSLRHAHAVGQRPTGPSPAGPEPAQPEWAERRRFRASAGREHGLSSHWLGAYGYEHRRTEGDEDMRVDNTVEIVLARTGSADVAGRAATCAARFAASSGRRPKSSRPTCRRSRCRTSTTRRRNRRRRRRHRTRRRPRRTCRVARIAMPSSQVATFSSATFARCATRTRRVSARMRPRAWPSAWRTSARASTAWGWARRRTRRCDRRWRRGVGGGATRGATAPAA